MKLVTSDAQLVEKNLGLPVIMHPALQKPDCIASLLGHFNLKDIQDARHMLIVGDRVLSDVAMGHKHGMVTLLVKPVSNYADNFIVRVV